MSDVVKKSVRKNKKYDVFRAGKYKFSFGDSRYQHYKDKIGDWEKLDHNDEKRRKAYKDRWRNKYNDKVKDAVWYAWNYLW